MQELKNRLSGLRKLIAQKGEEDKKLRELFKKTLLEIFGDEKIPDKYIRDFYFKQGKLIVTATNKSFANELFLRKEIILEKLNSQEMKIKFMIIK